MDAGAEVRGVESQGVGSQTPLNAPNIPYIDDIQVNLGDVEQPMVTPHTGLNSTGVDQLNPTDASGNGWFWPPMPDFDTRRWMSLEHGFDFQPQSSGQEDMLVSDIDQTAFNDFSRFLEQAGTSSSDTELFPW